STTVLALREVKSRRSEQGQRGENRKHKNRENALASVLHNSSHPSENPPKRQQWGLTPFVRSRTKAIDRTRNPPRFRSERISQSVCVPEDYQGKARASISNV